MGKLLTVRTSRTTFLDLVIPLLQHLEGFKKKKRKHNLAEDKNPRNQPKKPLISQMRLWRLLFESAVARLARAAGGGRLMLSELQAIPGNL